MRDTSGHRPVLFCLVLLYQGAHHSDAAGQDGCCQWTGWTGMGLRWNSEWSPLGDTPCHGIHLDFGAFAGFPALYKA